MKILYRVLILICILSTLSLIFTIREKRRGAPTYWEAYKRFGKKVGAANTAVILALTYCIVIGPVSVAARLLRKDPLRLRPRGGSLWDRKIMPRPDLERFKRQF